MKYEFSRDKNKCEYFKPVEDSSFPENTELCAHTKMDDTCMLKHGSSRYVWKVRVENFRSYPSNIYCTGVVK